MTGESVDGKERMRKRAQERADRERPFQTKRAMRERERERREGKRERRREREKCVIYRLPQTKRGKREGERA